MTSNDGPTSVPVVAVNETVARSWWPNGNAIGDRLVIGLFRGQKLIDGAPREVVGIVGDTKDMPLDAPPRPTVFVPVEQTAADASQLAWQAAGPASLAWAVRTDGTAAIGPSLRRAVAEIDPVLHVVQLRTMDEILKGMTATSRFNALLFAIFAAVAAVLASVGLYGVSSFLVTQRTQEIGTRMALGAGRADVFGLFLRQGIVLTTIGVAAGLAIALLAMRWLSSLLYGVRANDPSSFAVVALLFLIVGAASSSLPARRATRIDPAASLRAE